MDDGRVPSEPDCEASPSAGQEAVFAESHPSREEYARGLLAEECAELIQTLGKAARFGIDTPGPDRAPYLGMTARELLEMECGDVLAAIEWATYAGLIQHHRVEGQRQRKLARLFDPSSRDSLGRRLAPDVARAEGIAQPQYPISQDKGA